MKDLKLRNGTEINTGIFDKNGIEIYENDSIHIDGVGEYILVFANDWYDSIVGFHFVKTITQTYPSDFKGEILEFTLMDSNLYTVVNN